MTLAETLNSIKAVAGREDGVTHLTSTLSGDEIRTAGEYRILHSGRSWAQAMRTGFGNELFTADFDPDTQTWEDDLD